MLSVTNLKQTQKQANRVQVQKQDGELRNKTMQFKDFIHYKLARDGSPLWLPEKKYKDVIQSVT